MHLTNYSVNKHNENFERDETVDKGSKRSINWFTEFLRSNDYDVAKFWGDISVCCCLTETYAWIYLSVLYFTLHFWLFSFDTCGASVFISFLSLLLQWYQIRVILFSLVNLPSHNILWFVIQVFIHVSYKLYSCIFTLLSQPSNLHVLTFAKEITLYLFSLFFAQWNTGSLFRCCITWYM